MNAGAFCFYRGTNYLSRRRRTVNKYMRSAALAVIYPVEAAR